MEIRPRFFILTFLFCYSLAYGNQGCLSRELNRLVKQNKKTSSSFISPEKITAFNEMVTDDYKKMIRYNRLIKSIEKNSNHSRLFKRKQKRILNEKMLNLNLKILGDIKEFLSHQGIKTKIVRTEDKSSALKILKNDQEPVNKAHEFYLKIEDKYEAQGITISAYDNVINKSGGFYQNSTKRVEVGVGQALKFSDELISLIGKHETRHLISHQNHLKGKPNIYYQEFFPREGYSFALKGDAKTYEHYLSGEEIYNYSTDIGEMFRKMKRNMTKEIYPSERDISIITDRLKVLKDLSKVVGDQTSYNISLLKKLKTDIGKAKSSNELEFLLRGSNIRFDLKEGVLRLSSGQYTTTIPFSSQRNQLKLKQNCCELKDLKDLVREALNKQEILSKVARAQKKQAEKLIKEAKDIVAGKDHADFNKWLRDLGALSNSAKSRHKNFAGRSDLNLASYEIFKDISDSPKKVQKLNTFLNYAKTKEVGPIDNFIKDLNEIHLTGIKKEQGLDISKDRNMVQFLKKYPTIEKRELMTLAKQDVGILDKANPSLRIEDLNQDIQKFLKTKASLFRSPDEELNYYDRILRSFPDITLKKRKSIISECFGPKRQKTILCFNENLKKITSKSYVKSFQAVRDYTSYNNAAVNGYLRGRKAGDKALQKSVKRLDTFLKYVPKKERTVFRWNITRQNRIDEIHDAFKNKKEIIMDEGYMSASEDISLNRGFGEMKDNKREVLMVMDTKEGADVTHLSAYPEEREVLINRGVSWKIEDYIEIEEFCRKMNLRAKGSDLLIIVASQTRKVPIEYKKEVAKELCR